MDHNHMGHGGMDMPSEGHRCNMNVRQTCLPHCLISSRLLTAPLDAVHMGHDRSLHRLQTMAHLLDLHPDILSHRRRRPSRRL